jgi:cytochrome c peroxidase
MEPQVAKPASSPILQLIRRAVEDRCVRELPDHQLLQRFHARHDQAAFSALLRRHGPMVLEVSRAVLGNEADAEDAFQATFLVLARKAGSIRQAASLASWLHGVVYRTALKAQVQSATRQKHEARAPVRQTFEPDDMNWREVRRVLHEELNGLSECHRVPLVLCYLQGKTQEQAAKELGLAKSTLREHLERGRDLLRARLVRRGLGPVALLVAAAWPAADASAGVPPAVVASTVSAASLVAAGQATTAVASARVAALTEGVLTAMSLSKLTIATAVLLSLAVLGGLSRTFSSVAADPPARATTAERGANAQAGERPPVTGKPGEGAKSLPSTPRTPRLPEVPYHYADLDLPAHFKTPVAQRFDNTPTDNPVTDAGATLGRVLFYDTRLSANNTVSCGSCHAQKNAFADPNRLSKGFEGQLTDRHAMSVANLRYSPRGWFFWDERADSLEEAVLVPVQSRTEMGQDLARLTEVLSKDEHYPEVFQKAFGDGKVTPARTARALAQFLRSLVSNQSKYDEGRARAGAARDDFENFTVQENRGKALFLSNCASCHLPPGQDAHFAMIAPENNGLDADLKSADGGVGDITLDGRQFGRFRSPSLRNVERTAPYMHDGRFDTLEKVIDHYSKGVQPHPNLSPRARRLNFTDSERAALVAFLKTLTDQKFLTDPKFSDPFQ